MGRNLYIVKHGERMDFTLNTSESDWISRAFDESGNYTKFNLNMPRRMHKRSDGHRNYFLDPPLTKVGLFQARLTGKAFRDENITISHVFCSPALRCIQTCASIIRGYEKTQLQIKIDPGLFEWGQWFIAHNQRFPDWIKPEELQSFGYPIDLNYQPIMDRSKLNVYESLQDFYNRSHTVVRAILDSKKVEGGNVLIVAHGASPETLSRQLCGGTIPADHDFYRILYATSYLSCLRVTEDLISNMWNRDASPILPLSHTHNSSYNPQVHYC